MLKNIARKMPCTEGFLKWVLPRGIVVGLALIASVFFIGYAPRIETGVVEYKMVTGCREHCSHVLMLKTASKAVMLAEETNDAVLHDTGFFVIDEELEHRLSSSYSDIRYCISVRIPGSDNTTCLAVPREIFNGLRTNSVVRFEIRGRRSNEIKRIVNEIADNGFRNDRHFPEYNGLRHFVNQ
ncbi:MAG: hypothetical protein OEV79_11755 [candidate division WOR-3 bacterium]|nr:hypothetical protein [candidate division WOR-3 bacterium]